MLMLVEAEQRKVRALKQSYNKHARQALANCSSKKQAVDEQKILAFLPEKRIQITFKNTILV